MGTTLASREDGFINTLLEVGGIRTVLPEEDKTSTRASKGLVSGGGNDIAVLEGVVQLLSSNEAGCVGNVCHEPGALLVGNFAEFSIIPVAGVSGSTADDETGLEDLRLSSKTSVIDEVGVGCDGIRVGLEVDRRRSHLLLSGLKTAV